MKKKDLIFISIIIILILSLVGTIIYYNQDKTINTTGEVLAVGSNYLLIGTPDNEDYVVKTTDINYQVGDKVELELKKINKKKTPYESTAKNINIIESKEQNNIDNQLNENSNNIDNTSNNKLPSNQESTNNNDITNNVETNNKEDNSEQPVIKYFEDLNNDITTYNSNNDDDETLGKTIKEKFVKGIDFLFYDEEIGGKTFKELTNATKLKILEIAMIIDSKIESKFPGYKDSINNSYQNIKTKIVEKYLEITTDICNNDPNLCVTAKEGFSNLKEKFGITWDVIKELTKNGVTKLKDWYEIWRYQ